MSRYWNPDIRELSPYIPGEQPREREWVKLNTNELPEGPSPKVLEALRGACDESLRLYPDPENRRLREVWASKVGMKPTQVFPGNGSDEVLAHCFRAFFGTTRLGLLQSIGSRLFNSTRSRLFGPARPVLFPDITYSFYPVYGALFGLDCQTVPLAADFGIDLATYDRPNGGIIFPNPNAPTGIPCQLDNIQKLLVAQRDSVVVVDEAYIDFGGQSALGLIDDHPNLLVVQTLSKSRALAGLRVGAAFGQEHLIEGLMRVKNSFNSYPLGRLAEAGAVAALDDEDWFEAARAKLIENRESLRARLQELGFAVLPSVANFLLASHPGRDGAALYKALRERGILVRHFANRPRIEQHLRISIGTTEQCDILVQVLMDILSSAN